MFMELHREEKRGKETEVAWRIKWEIKSRESNLASNQIPRLLSTVWNPQRGSQICIEKRRWRKQTQVIIGEKGESKEERPILSVISSLSVLHSLEHTKRFTELGREEKGDRGDRGDLVEKKESQMRERAIKPVITLPSKNGY